MGLKIEDYALIGDCEGAALVGRDGSIDWLCLPRFDSAACFASLLGDPSHGRWLIAPDADVRHVRRCYREGTLILETEFEVAGGVVVVIDFMPVKDGKSNVVRIVEGRRGKVPMLCELVLRPDYGSVVPWVRHQPGGITAMAGPDGFRLSSPVDLKGKDFASVAHFEVTEGQRLPFVLTWHPAHTEAPALLDPFKALEVTSAWWKEWSGRCGDDSPWKDAVVRSLITLKALTYAPTGGIVAAPTTSLPEHLGGVRNWDYRYCWLRDATFTLLALLDAGYEEEARSWREWLLRAAAGKPSQLHIMYGIAGERRLPELELPWLPGYENSAPVRTGNGAYDQLQLDVFGEVMDALHQCWRVGMPPGEGGWHIERAMVEYLEGAWHQPDEGIWEVRGPRQHFTHSKVMAWVAMDRAVKGVEMFGLEGPVQRWRDVRDKIHAQVCQEGYNSKKGTFVQHYGSDLLDASLLMMPLVGFLPATDDRVVATVAGIQRELTKDGFVSRYETSSQIDGLPAGDGAFLLCSFWLADNLQLQGRQQEARELFEHLLSVRNDVGLLSESYDVKARRLVGNFPQAFSHIGLINTARHLSHPVGPTGDRC